MLSGESCQLHPIGSGSSPSNPFDNCFGILCPWKVGPTMSLPGAASKEASSWPKHCGGAACFCTMFGTATKEEICHHHMPTPDAVDVLETGMCMRASVGATKRIRAAPQRGALGLSAQELAV